MKKSILTVLFVGSIALAQAQTEPQKQPEIPVYIKILPSRLNALQQLLQYSYQWLPKSSAPSNEVQQALDVIKEVYPFLVADTTKRVTPVKKK